jgi:hypothetical protein
MNFVVLTHNDEFIFTPVAFMAETGWPPFVAPLLEYRLQIHDGV